MQLHIVPLLGKCMYTLFFTTIHTRWDQWKPETATYHFSSGLLTEHKLWKDFYFKVWFFSPAPDLTLESRQLLKCGGASVSLISELNEGCYVKQEHKWSFNLQSFNIPQVFFFFWRKHLLSEHTQPPLLACQGAPPGLGRGRSEGWLSQISTYKQPLYVTVCPGREGTEDPICCLRVSQWPGQAPLWARAWQSECLSLFGLW